MYEQVEKKENRSRAVASAVSQNQSGGESTFQFVDNRPEAIAQRKLQEIADVGTVSHVTQRMAAIAGGKATFNKKDFTQLSHLDWAVKISGGPIVDLDASIAAIGDNNDLHLVQHGSKGAMQYQVNDTKTWIAIKAGPIASLLIKFLPNNYTGKIRISSCYSGTPEQKDNDTTSLVGQIKTLIQSSNRADLADITIVGWDGPTITNINLESDSGTGAETVDANKVTRAGQIQDALLRGKYKQLKKDWEQNVGSDTRSLDILAAAAAKNFEEFYQEFTNECKKEKLLLKYVDSLVIA